MQTGTGVAFRLMTKRPPRPVFHTALGRFFEELRTARQWGQSEAVSIAQRRGLKRLTRQVLIRLEKGATKNPSREVLEDIAALYNLNYADVVRVVVMHAYAPAGSKQEDSSNASPSQAGVHVASIAYARVVQQRDNLIAALVDVKAFLNEKIGDLIDADPEVGNTAQRPPRVRRTNRSHRR